MGIESQLPGVVHLPDNAEDPFDVERHEQVLITFHKCFILQ